MDWKTFKKLAFRGLFIWAFVCLYVLIAQFAQITTFAQLPSTGLGGALNFMSNSIGFLVNQNGSGTRTMFGPVYRMVAPPTSGWTNENGGTWDTTYGYPTFKMGTLGSQQIRDEYRTAPGSTPYTCKALVYHMLDITGTVTDARTAFGMNFRDSSGKLVVFLFYTDNSNNFGFWTAKWNSYSSHNADYKFLANASAAFVGFFASNNPFWMYIEDDSTNLNMGFYMDPGQNYPIQVDSRSRTDFFSSGPTQVGLAGQPWESGTNLIVPSWECRSGGP